MFRTCTCLIMCWFTLTACASKPQTGIMAADWTPPPGSEVPRQKVTIAWESRAATTGNMTFTLGRGGQRYIGSYLLIEKTTSHLDIQPHRATTRTGRHHRRTPSRRAARRHGVGPGPSTPLPGVSAPEK